MTMKRFWDDPYATMLDTCVASVTGNDLTLEETIFYAFSGGQESDSGTIGDHRVIEARKDGKTIVYTLDTGHGLRPGDNVIVRIDWDRRYRLMRLHFAAELVLELVSQTLPGIEKIGAHIALDKSRIDFAHDENISPLLPMIAAQAQALIEANHPIVSAYSDEENQRRYWEVAGFARVPCGGTHLKTTGE